MIVDSVQPTSFVIPKHSKAVRDTLKAEKGTLVLMTDDNTVYYSTSANVGSAYWKKITAA